MTSQDKSVTALVRAMKGALLRDHGIKVPHTALRASYLQAQGEHPHAFGVRESQSLTELERLQALIAEAPKFFAPQCDFDGQKLAWLERAGLVAPPAGLTAQGELRTLYLVEDEIGCLERLALDPDGAYALPDSWQFMQAAALVRQSAQVPSIRRYGLPEYLANAAGFFERFTLGLSPDYRTQVEDLGDDSGDSCTLAVRLSSPEWERLVVAVLSTCADLADEVGEWVGLNYGRNFDAMTSADRVDWVERYLASFEQDEAGYEGDTLDVKFEWVYPDEDSDNRMTEVDLLTGVLSLKDGQEPIPRVARDPSVRTRVWAEDYDEEPFEAYYQQQDDSGVWRLTTKALTALRDALNWSASA